MNSAHRANLLPQRCKRFAMESLIGHGKRRIQPSQALPEFSLFTFGLFDFR